MAIAPEGHLRARREAPYHVQVEIVDRPGHVETTARVTVEGRVVRVFRSKAVLSVGTLVSFKLPVYVEREGMPTGPFCLPYRAFAAATHLEVYMEGTPPHCRVACEEFCVIDRPSETPVLNIDELERLTGQGRSTGHPALRDSWRFWRRLL